MNFGPTDYRENKTPEQYRCVRCGATNVKLWRLYQTFLENQELTCVVCSGKLENCDVSTMDIMGRRLVEPHGCRRTDQIGCRVPAVPTEQGNTFWGDTSVPSNGVIWWRRLPTWPIGRMIDSR